VARDSGKDSNEKKDVFSQLLNFNHEIFRLENAERSADGLLQAFSVSRKEKHVREF
jgi:hypothetical protein